MPVVWSDRHRLHEPGGEIWVGVRTPGTELPERAERIRAALAESGARFVEAEPQPDAALEAVHDPALLSYLAGAWEEWEAAGLADGPGRRPGGPLPLPPPGLVPGRPPGVPAAITARAGRFAYDTMTLIGPGHLGGGPGRRRRRADRGRAGARRASRAAYACCRPPGHHATAACFGGSCYLNNSAAAAARLRAALDGPIAVIDVDAHHGNGTQSVFYEDPEVLVGSVHVDPGAGWFPHYPRFRAPRPAAAPAKARIATCRSRRARATVPGSRPSAS